MTADPQMPITLEMLTQILDFQNQLMLSRIERLTARIKKLEENNDH